MTRSPHIAVIGSGMAGLSCSNSLHGAHLHLFDKSSSPGGRMSTRRGETWQCDHGPQYFTARDADFRAEVAGWEAAGVAGVWEARLAVFGDIEGHRSDGRLDRYVGVPLMSEPARLLAERLPPATQTTISRVEHTPEGWRLHSIEEGELAMRFDAVVLAVPAPQAVPLLQDSAPELAALAAQVAMRGSWALMLRYDAPLEFDFDAAFVNRGPLRWVARDNSKPGRAAQETWLLHANAEWSEAHIEEAPETVAAALIAAFGELGAPAPQAWTAHRWRYADTDPPLDAGHAWDAALRIGLCGDWLNGGKVEGAWLSGRALAREVAQTFGLT